MDEFVIPGRSDGLVAAQRIQASYDAPAYVRRARQVQDAFDQLIGRCRLQRDRWLPMVRLRLGLLRELAGDWQALLPWLADVEQVGVLRQLHEDLNPRLRVPVQPTSSARVLRRALRELRESIERFNRRWQEFLPRVDLARVNELRDGYNRYYLLEKECAVRSAALARAGFCRLEPLTSGELAALVPHLPVPLLKKSV
jgi:hypothetical protein